MDKLKKIKHDHKLTDLLKFVIFSLIMLAPFFSIGGRMAYTIFNKNAKDSYSEGSLIQNISEITNTTQLIDNNTYTYVYNPELTSSATQQRIGFKQLSFDLYEKWPLTPVNNYVAFATYGQSNALILYYLDSGNNLQTYYGNNLTFNFTFVCDIAYTINNNPLLRCNLYTYTFNKMTLDNAFDYSISKIADEPVFNWVKNTAIYDGINAMFTGLEYDTNNNPIAIMCAYWLLNTAVYIVIDIVVWAFTKMTHMFVQE